MPHDHNFSAHTQTEAPTSLEAIHEHRTPILEGNETRTRWVVWITLVTMVVELVVGFATNSMALIADGWHMASHAGALGLTLFGYNFARKYDNDPRFSFGTGKVFALTGFASASALFMAGILVTAESIHHMLEGDKVNDFAMAMWVAVIGLVINLLSALLLSHDESAGHSHGHSHGHNHDHSHNHSEQTHEDASHGHDHNLKGAYLHVIADALTSVLAIAALFLGKQFGWWFLDPLMGIVGGVIIIRWAVQLTRETGWVLLNALPNRDVEGRVRHHFEHVPDVDIVDLHIWDLGLGRHCCILSVISDEPKSPNVYKQGLCAEVSLHHCTIEVHRRSDIDASLTEHHEHHDHDHDHHHH